MGGRGEGRTLHSYGGREGENRRERKEGAWGKTISAKMEFRTLV